ncbi:MAG: ACP S-malonyltransferase [Chloroflexota bacterium]
MGNIAFIFPGQGSQRVGMGKQLCERYPDIEERYFRRADEVLGFSLSALCFDGPAEELIKTEIQQPALFLVSCASFQVLRDRGMKPAAVAGHSLGEYSALAAAGALSFEDGLRLTRRRGELMAEIAARTGGMMAAVLGLAVDEVETVCARAATSGVVEIANYNSPAQTVISGEEPAVRQAMALATEAGARRVIPLPVSAPFHCSLMAPLAERFEPALAETRVDAPGVPVVANVNACYERSPEEVRRNLVQQLDHAVRWTDSMRRLIADGFDTFVEVGPERVLAGLMRSIDSSVSTYGAGDPEGIDRTVRQA